MSTLRIKKRKKKFKAADLPIELKHVNLDAAGIDVGSDRLSLLKTPFMR